MHKYRRNFRNHQARKMKALSKPISSPGRVEKFPPPLMRFLRSNVASRSRGRSRPMFFLRSRKPTGVLEEPSSPTVTCIGQVKIRRKKANIKSSATSKRRCFWWRVKKLKIPSRFCTQKKPFCGIFTKRCSFFRFGYCKKVDATEESFRVFSKKSENFGDLVEEKRRDSIELCSSSAPPRNALSLTRCRSAPYRSSSLAGRFWGSPLRTGGDESECQVEKIGELEIENVVEDSRINEESCNDELESCKELKVIGNGAVHPLLLTRCKSESAKTGEKLIPEASGVWKLKRFGAVEPSLN